jgi:hypothetical protein
MIWKPTATVLLTFSLTVIAQTPSPEVSPSGARDFHTLRIADGLHQLAVQHGGFFLQTVRIVPWVRHDSLADLAKESNIVVEVDVVSNRCVLIDGGRGIETRYIVAVDNVYKGTVRPGEQLVVTLAGGRFRYPDGSAAQVDVPNQKRLGNNRRYILFLGSSGDGEYSPAGFDEGAFELLSDGSIRPHASAKDAPLQKESQFPNTEFKNRVLRAVKASESETSVH